jgi:threonine dehydratase
LSLPHNKITAGFCTHSSGNHAQAIAYAAKSLKVPAYIVMPETANPVKVKAVANYGAEIIFCAPTQRDREATVERVRQETGATFIHPYNDSKVIEGQATAAKELIAAFPDINTLFAPVGGGGLLSGSCLSARYFGKNIQVYGCEPEQANDAWMSMQSGQIEPARGLPTSADGLMTSLGDLTFEIIRNEVSGIITVTEDQIAEAMKFVWERMKLIIEPSSAVPLAALLNNRELFVGRKIGIIISGGNVDFSQLAFLKEPAPQNEAKVNIYSSY